MNVPDASICVIERAERFSLSQIHQIRGRIGRGDPPPLEILSSCHCVPLHSKDIDPIAEDKLQILSESTDGFEIAKEDLALRKACQFFGSEQSGKSKYKLFDFEHHLHLLPEAKLAAQALQKGTYGADSLSSDNEKVAVMRTFFTASDGEGPERCETPLLVS